MLIEPQRHSQLHVLHLPEESTPPTDMHAAKQGGEISGSALHLSFRGGV
jgi:hypothetical protein